MKTVAEAIGVSRSNLASRLQERCKKRIGRPPRPDDELVSKIKAVIAELATYGYRRVHAVLKRQALAAGLKPPNHKRVYRVMKVHGLLLDRHVGGDERRHDGRIAVWKNVIGVGAPTALRSAATTASGCGLRLRSTAVIGKP